ncbi:AlkA N-terminal domain-containing protein [Saccharothrix violaceirubra]|uniref:AraC family transcriptional regulator of adaptative response / DNA-3-methyladenine glycosylase II n=1 Tax=Saccharothrix violaceirubra TaxID=413306 RepID=A0A7W7T8D1_9PSEU|nr:AlkA N-terminal domain-containing protein [Saccharothrix violaceirubra]MBB4968454.1 AraC family transcriptional regulator of adaptative response / DNA-3-methyladenine glycosylase II [Saccharothrix violaceirubra]
MLVDDERAYRAVAARDARFDGCFILAVRTTRIYCRPSCPAVTPKRRNAEFYPTAAAAQSAGYRACRRCLPDAVPGSPEWNLRADLAARAMRLISDGVVEREGVSGLASRLGYSERHLTRVLTAELGAGPLALARAHRAHSARLLIETTDLSFADVAFAAGFASVRQFNDTIRAVFASTPSAMRARRCAVGAPGRIVLRLPYRPPFDFAGLLEVFAVEAIPGVEHVTWSSYARSLRLPHGEGTVLLEPSDGHVRCSLRLTDLRDLGSAVSRVRRLLDLDADPQAVDSFLSADPALRPSVLARPGVRLPGSVDGAETLLRLLGHRRAGEPLRVPDGEVTHLYPEPAAVDSPVARALADGGLVVDVGCDQAELEARLTAFPGVGADIARQVVVRVLGAPDVPSTTDNAAWRPWRSYAALHSRRIA